MKKYLALFTSLSLIVPAVAITTISSEQEINKKVEAAAKTHWITTASGIRHNKSCRYYKNSKGRMCTPNEGRACKKCKG